MAAPRSVLTERSTLIAVGTSFATNDINNGRSVSTMSRRYLSPSLMSSKTRKTAALTALVWTLIPPRVIPSVLA